MDPHDVEILVHVTAPSRAADDANYRHLARRYLAFQPGRRIDISAPHLHTTAQQNRVHVESSSQDYVTPITEAICAESQDLSFQSALDNRSSPHLPHLRPNKRFSQHRLPQTPSQASWRAPPSQIADSYPLPSADIIHVTPTRVLQRYLQKTPSSSPSSSNPLIAHSQPEIHIPSSIPIPSNDSHPLNIPITSCPENIPEKEDTTHISNSFISRSESEPPPSKIPKTDLPRSASDTSHIHSPPPAIDLIAQTLEIKPPSPPIDVADLDPTSLVSPKLEKLSRDLSSRFKAVFHRQVEPFERGYWLVDCRRWSEETRLHAWVFLTNYLKSGLAGWGVWCGRDELHEWIRFYCWGHVAKHVYLLMYLASGRQIKGTGARWFDGEGLVALEVGGVERR